MQALAQHASGGAHVAPDANIGIHAMLVMSCHGSIPVAAWPNSCCSIFKHISKSGFLLEHSASGNGLDSLIAVWQQVVEPDEDLCSFLHPMV